MYMRILLPEGVINSDDLEDKDPEEMIGTIYGRSNRASMMKKRKK